MAQYQTPASVLANYKYDPASPSGLAWARDYTKGKAGNPAGTRNGLGYWVVKSEGRMWLAHSIIHELTKGPIPEGQTVDHKEGLSNLVDNLRLADSAQQSHNQGPKKTSTTGIKTRNRLHGEYARSQPHV